MVRFSGQAPTGSRVQELEVLVRTAIFKPATALVGYLLQGAADRIDAAYQAKPGQARKGRASLQVDCLRKLRTRQKQTTLLESSNSHESNHTKESGTCCRLP